MTELTPEDKARIEAEERERVRARAQAEDEFARHPARDNPEGNMAVAAILGLLLGLIGLGIGLVYTASADRDKKLFGRQLIAWSVAGMCIWFVLFLYFPSLLPTPPALTQCVICGGAGIVDCPICVNGTMRNPVTGSMERCTFCNGAGKSTCTFCNGTGKAQR
jgi:hypothetical protein